MSDDSIEDFFKIMSQLDSLTPQDIDYSAELIYREISQSLKDQVQLPIQVSPKELKKHSTSLKKPSRVQHATVYLSDTKLGSTDQLSFKEQFRQHAADYATSWVRKAHKRNREEMTERQNSNGASSNELDSQTQNVCRTSSDVSNSQIQSICQSKNTEQESISDILYPQTQNICQAEELVSKSSSDVLNPLTQNVCQVEEFASESTVFNSQNKMVCQAEELVSKSPSNDIDSQNICQTKESVSESTLHGLNPQTQNLFNAEGIVPESISDVLNSHTQNDWQDAVSKSSSDALTSQTQNTCQEEEFVSKSTFDGLTSQTQKVCRVEEDVSKSNSVFSNSPTQNVWQVDTQKVVPESNSDVLNSQTKKVCQTEEVISKISSDTIKSQTQEMCQESKAELVKDCVPKLTRLPVCEQMPKLKKICKTKIKRLKERKQNTIPERKTVNNDKSFLKANVFLQQIIDNNDPPKPSYTTVTFKSLPTLNPEKRNSRESNSFQPQIDVRKPCKKRKYVNDSRRKTEIQSQPTETNLPTEEQEQMSHDQNLVDQHTQKSKVNFTDIANQIDRKTVENLAKEHTEQDIHQQNRLKILKTSGVKKTLKRVQKPPRVRKTKTAKFRKGTKKRPEIISQNNQTISNETQPMSAEETVASPMHLSTTVLCKPGDNQSKKQAPDKSTLGQDDIKQVIHSILSSEQINTPYIEALSQIQDINKSLLQTVEEVQRNQHTLSDFETKTNALKEQQKALRDTIKEIRDLSKLYSEINTAQSKQTRGEESEKIHAKLETLQMEHDIKLNQIQSSIAIAEINAKSQAHNIQSQYELGLGKLKLEEWKTNLQTVLNKETTTRNHDHQFDMLKMQAEIEREKQQQRDWYIAQESDRERIFKKELQDSKFLQEIQMENIEKQFRQFQEQQRQEHEMLLKSRAENFAMEIEKLKTEQQVFMDEKRQLFSRQIEKDRQDYEVNILKIKEDFSRDRDERKRVCDEESQTRDMCFQRQMEKDKMEFSIDMAKIKQEFTDRNLQSKQAADFEVQKLKQQFTAAIEERKLQTSHLIATQKEHIEKYKADLIAEVKLRQTEKQDENEKLKIQLKMAEYELKLKQSSGQSSFNKFQFKVIPSPISTFEYQMEKSSESAPCSVIRTFEQLWNTQYDPSMDLPRILKLKNELLSAAKKAVENHAAFRIYLTEDLPKWIMQMRFTYLNHFKRPGMFIFKTAQPYSYTKYSLSRVDKERIQDSMSGPNRSAQFTVPRYSLIADGNCLVDMLEFMDTQLLFPQNACYNIDLSSGDKILAETRILTCPGLVRNIIYGDTTNFGITSIDPNLHVSYQPKKSMPIYVSENRMLIPAITLRK